MDTPRSLPLPLVLVFIAACTLVGGGVIEIVFSGPPAPTPPPGYVEGPDAIGLGCDAAYTLAGSTRGFAGWRVVSRGGDAALVAQGRYASPRGDGVPWVAIRGTQAGSIVLRALGSGGGAEAAPVALLDRRVEVATTEACE